MPSKIKLVQIDNHGAYRIDVEETTLWSTQLGLLEAVDGLLRLDRVKTIFTLLTDLASLGIIEFEYDFYEDGVYSYLIK